MFFSLLRGTARSLRRIRVTGQEEEFFYTEVPYQKKRLFTKKWVAILAKYPRAITGVHFR